MPFSASCTSFVVSVHPLARWGRPHLPAEWVQGLAACMDPRRAASHRPIGRVILARPAAEIAHATVTMVHATVMTIHATGPIAMKIVRRAELSATGAMTTWCFEWCAGLIPPARLSLNQRSCRSRMA
jgi:hypothetical protein